MQKIGHRGAKGYVAENTLASFKKAFELGANGIELDVHLSADGEVMVIHDDTIDRTTSRTGLVNNFKVAALNELGIPTLKDVLELANNNFIVNIELKNYNTVEKVMKIIQDYISEKDWNIENFIISSFDWLALEKARLINSNIKTGVLTEDNIDEAINFAKQIKAFSINPFFKLLNFEKVALIHDEGFQIHTWTVNTLEDISFVKSLNVDAIISDFPDRI